MGGEKVFVLSCQKRYHNVYDRKNNSYRSKFKIHFCFTDFIKSVMFSFLFKRSILQLGISEFPVLLPLNFETIYRWNVLIRSVGRGTSNAVNIPWPQGSNRLHSVWVVKVLTSTVVSGIIFATIIILSFFFLMTIAEINMLKYIGLQSSGIRLIHQAFF